mgnify:CR=1 FL=1
MFGRPVHHHHNHDNATPMQTRHTGQRGTVNELKLTIAHSDASKVETCCLLAAQGVQCFAAPRRSESAISEQRDDN